MRWLKAGLSLVLAACLTLIPVTATKASTHLTQELASSLGCSATVTSHDSSEFNAYYNSNGNQIILIGFNNLPPEWQTLLFLHEVGHCLQHESGEYSKIQARGPYEIEWDADAFAIKKLGELYGIDGAELNHQVLAYVYQTFEYEEDLDDSHGLPTHRIIRGNLNRTTPKVEAP